MCVDVRYYRAAATSRAETSTRASHRWRHFAGAVSWLLPSAALALMPKCPACFAAYFAAATGLGLSLSTAAHIRSATIAFCALILTVMVVALVSRARFLRRA
jgi:hypothetical protein